MKTTKEILGGISSSHLMEEVSTAMQNQQYREAMNLVNVYLLRKPDDIEARLKKGLCYLYLNEASKAAFIFDMVLENSPEHPEALACYAEYYKLMLDYRTAAHYISAAIAADEENASYHQLAAEIAFLSNDRDLAYGMINRAIVLSPFREGLYFWRALILNSYKKVNVALNDLNRALSLNPQHIESLKLRAKIKMYHGTFEDALKDLRLVQRLEDHASAPRMR